jgi:hypothetical protein
MFKRSYAAFLSFDGKRIEERIPGLVFLILKVTTEICKTQGVKDMVYNSKTLFTWNQTSSSLQWKDQISTGERGYHFEPR